MPLPARRTSETRVLRRTPISFVRRGLFAINRWSSGPSGSEGDCQWVNSCVRQHCSMKPKFLLRLFASIALSSVAAITLGSVVAQAASQPNVVGQKYSDAASQLSTAGLSVVVSTTVGDTVSRPNCIVTRQQSRTEAAPENTSSSPVNQVLLSLNCGAQVASATVSPTG